MSYLKRMKVAVLFN